MMPTVFDDHIREMEVDGTKCVFELYDSTSHNCHTDHLKQFEYKDTHVFVVCFALDDPGSLESVREKWFPQIKCLCPQSQILLVGTKTDTRGAEASPLSRAQGEQMASEIGACGYRECSALDGVGVNEIFLEAARVGCIAVDRGDGVVRKLYCAMCCCFDRSRK